MRCALRFFTTHFALDERDTFCIVLRIMLKKLDANDHREIIRTVWRMPESYAEAIGIPPRRGRGHWQRNSIPSDYWDEACASAQNEGYQLTLEVLKRTKIPRAKTLMCKASREEISAA
jgi:hypothetical protein